MKIAEVIKKSELYRLADVGYDQEFDWNSHNPPDYTMSEHLKEATQAILDLIAKELPKVKMGISIKNVEQWELGYNQCLKDIKHNLGVEL